MARRDRPVISLFSGALGLDLGLERAGFCVRVAVECNRFAAETIRLNRPDLPLIQRRIEDVSTEEILDAAGLEVGGAAVVTAGPSCQVFSTAGQRGSLRDPRGGLFRQFLRVVKEARPRFFVMENVRGVVSAAIRHRPLRKRGPGYPALTPEEELGSAFAVILRELRRTGYYTVFDLLNAADYGVPQTRQRLVFIGSRDGEPVGMPTPTHAETPEDGQRPWVTLRQALAGFTELSPTFSALTPMKKRYLELIPAGGNWRSLPARRRWRALGGAYRSWGGRVGFFRRLAWDRPAPALTTRPDSKATMLCHPTEMRPLTVGEYARLQQFPGQWKVAGGLPQQYIQLGNAVPLGLGVAVGHAIRKAMRSRRERVEGQVVCANEELAERLRSRRRTILNPPRMRRFKTQKAVKRWVAQWQSKRAGPLKRLLGS